MAEDPFITRVIGTAKILADEPDVDVKYTTDELLRLLELAILNTMVDLNSVAANSLRCRHNITFAVGTQNYLLPPSIDQIVELAEIDSTSDRPLWWGYPSSDRSFCGPRFRLEGRVLRLDPTWTGESRTARLTYIPNGDFRLHYGTGTNPQATTLDLAASPTTGILDTRENCYVGAVLRILSDDGGYIQERTITSYDRTNRRATVNLAFDPVPAGTITYEVIPFYGRTIEGVLSYGLAEQLMTISGNTTKMLMLEKQHAKVKRALLISLARHENIVGQHFTHETREGQLNL